MRLAGPASLALLATLALGCAGAPAYAPAYGAPAYYGAPTYQGAPVYPGAPGYYGAPGYGYGYGPAPAAPQAARPPNGAVAVAFAQSRLGKPYCWGGTGPDCYDCSGLTHEAWRASGKSIPRTSSEQVASLPEVAMASIEPGDILWRPGHVALYVGQGWVISAPGTGDVVKYRPASGYQRAVRP
jgi:peptidoglycan DL-endopeptidase CwlO